MANNECNTCLPIGQIVKVDISIEDVLEQEEFNCVAILTSEPLGGIGGVASPVDANNLIEQYVLFDDIAANWDSSTDVYSAAQHVFQQTPRAGIVKVMYFDPAGDVQTQLDCLFKCDNCQGILIPELHDDPVVLDVAEWVEAQNGEHFYFTDTNDPLTLDPNDATSIAALLQLAGYDYTSAFYHSDITEEFAAAALSYGLGQDLDQNGSTFAMAYQNLSGVATDFLSASEVAAATGFLGSVGCGAEIGKFANVYTCYGSTSNSGIFYGTMASGNHFDTVLLQQYMTSRIQERMANILIGDTVSLTQQGINTAALELDFILSQYEAAGFIEDYVVEIPDINSTSVADRACRIVECFRFNARLAGRAQYFCVIGQLTF